MLLQNKEDKMKKVKGSCGQTPRVGKKGDAKGTGRGRRKGFVILELAVILAVGLYVGSQCGIVKTLDKGHEFMPQQVGNTYTIKTYSDMTAEEKVSMDMNDPYSDTYK